MKRTVELEDTLQGRVDGAIDKLKDLLLEYLMDYPETLYDGTPSLLDDLDYSGRFFELVDSSVPTYTHEIDTIVFLHGSDDGWPCGHKDWPCGWKAAAIWSYIKRELTDWYNKNADYIVERYLQIKKLK